MLIGLIQIDGKLPNLALMKLSAWHKAQGDEVTLLTPDDVLNGQDLFAQPDKIYAAVIFDKDVSRQTRKNAAIARRLNYVGVEVGGTGWDRPDEGFITALPAEVEKIRPDYDLFGIDYGMGFLSRGCIRRCGPCVVWRKEGYVHHVAWPEELVNPRSKLIVVLDGIFNASPHWQEKAQWFIDNDYTIDLTQGMDIRSVDDRAAELICAMKHRSKVHFAFDHIGDEQAVRRGLEILIKAGMRSDTLTLYILTNYDSTFEQDMRRIQIVEEYGANPYVMIFNKAKAPKQIRDLQRWCNSRPPIRKVCRFEDYDPKCSGGEGIR